MKILVYESLCAGGLGESSPASLRAEGWAMLRAVAGDFAKVADVSTLLTPDLPEISGVRCERTSFQDAASRFSQLIHAHDAVLPIAPESDGVLARVADEIAAAGRILLGCPPAAIRLASDKLALARHWRSRGIPTPDTRLVAGVDSPALPAVLKPPRWGGSIATRLVNSSEAWPRIKSEVEAELPGTEFIVQPFCAGTACSVSFLIGSRQVVPLLATEQTLSPDGHFHYRGGRIPLAPEHARRALDLATAAIAGIAGLSGYVGVDLVLGDDGVDVAIEINPRVTTSYVGLRAMCSENLADAWLRLAEGASDVSLAWNDRPMSFQADGRI